MESGCCHIKNEQVISSRKVVKDVGACGVWFAEEWCVVALGLVPWSYSTVAVALHFGCPCLSFEPKPPGATHQ